MKKYLFITVGTLLIIACSKESSDFQLSNFEIPVITGFQVRDHTGSTVQIIGNPNIKLKNESNRYSFISYPNPIKSYCYISIKSPADTYKKVWLVRADYMLNNEPVIETLGMKTLYVGGVPLFKGVIGPQSEAIILDLSSFKNGYYRIYLETDGILLYDNLVINNLITF
jgi:hypothetical protein